MKVLTPRKMSGVIENAGQVTPAPYLLLNIGRPIPPGQYRHAIREKLDAQILGAARHRRSVETNKGANTKKGAENPPPRS